MDDGPVVSPFTRIIGVDGPAPQNAPPAARGKSTRAFEYRPSELPNAKIGRRPIFDCMPTGLPALSSTEIEVGQLHEHRLFRLEVGKPVVFRYCQ